MVIDLSVFGKNSCCLCLRHPEEKKYGIEALNLQLHTLSPWQAAQLKWSRYINTTNRVGKNILMDLHLEHLNRRLKGTMRNMRANHSVTMAAQCVKFVDLICSQFEECTSGCATKTWCPIIEERF